jgi:hypothetical protein
MCGDLTALAALLDAGKLHAHEICAVIGKAEGNGGVNAFTRRYFNQSSMGRLAERLGGRPGHWCANCHTCCLTAPRAC